MPYHAYLEIPQTEHYKHNLTSETAGGLEEEITTLIVSLGLQQDVIENIVIWKPNSKNSIMVHRGIDGVLYGALTNLPIRL